MKPDFPLLYSQLGLNPDCSLDELKRAYRRRIAELHPDRQPQLPANDMALSDLNSIYALALRFHKQHGRLPGGKSPVAERTKTAARAQAPEPAPRERALVAAASPETGTGAIPPRNFTLWILLVLAILIVSLFLDSYSSKTAAEPKFPRSENARPTTVNPDAFVQLEIGMRAADVVALQGRPVRVRGEDWDYGPSWLRFDGRGRLVDWHSSPLRPLKAATESPPEPVVE